MIKQMKKLIFNTTEKTINVKDGYSSMYEMENITTVKPLDGYYEVMQRVDNETAPSGYSGWCDRALAAKIPEWLRSAGGNKKERAD